MQLASSVLAGDAVLELVKPALLRVAVAAGVCSGPDDSRWQAMAPQQIATQITTLGIERLKSRCLVDPRLRDHDILATWQTLNTIASDGLAASSVLVDSQLKASMKAAALAARLISAPDDPEWLSVDAIRVAREVTKASADPKGCIDAQLKARLRLEFELAARIADDANAPVAIARALENVLAKNALLETAVSLLKSTGATDPHWKSLSAQVT